MSRKEELWEQFLEEPGDLNSIDMRAADVASVSADAILLFMEGAQVLLGVCCILKSGRYAGRRGVVAGVIPDHEHGLRLLVNIERTDRRGFLDGDGDTRAYWAPTDLELDADWLRWTGPPKKTN